MNDSNFKAFARLEAEGIPINGFTVHLMRNKMAREAFDPSNFTLPSSTRTSATSQGSTAPIGPPQPTGSPSLIDGNGVVHDDVPGMGYQPRAGLGGPVRDTTISGTPRIAPKIEPSQPARRLDGSWITGPTGQPLHQRPSAP
jgi:hypothetical protein